MPSVASYDTNYPKLLASTLNQKAQTSPNDSYLTAERSCSFLFFFTGKEFYCGRVVLTRSYISDLDL
jgi:hypothetical protein